MAQSAIIDVLRSGRYPTESINAASDIVISALFAVSPELDSSSRSRLHSYIQVEKWNLIRELLDSEYWKNTTRARQHIEGKYREAARG